MLNSSWLDQQSSSIPLKTHSVSRIALFYTLLYHLGIQIAGVEMLTERVYRHKDKP